MKQALVIAAVFLAVSIPLSAPAATPSYEKYGRVVIGNFSPEAGMAKVVFDHWMHRSQFTCRVCHVDIGFLMEAGKTGIRAADNMKGYYCGACHNGRTWNFKGTVFRSCVIPVPKDTASCERCHSYRKGVGTGPAFAKFSEKLPKAGLGNGIDWEKAEEQGLITPLDNVPGISIKKQAMPVQKDFSLDSKSSWMGGILFSHKKHAKWNGCELCHPDIFGVGRGSTTFNMLQIYGGEYCGVCHVNVAFPLQDCDRCHTMPVR